MTNHALLSGGDEPGFIFSFVWSVCEANLESLSTLVELRLADHHGPWRCPGIGDLSCEAFREFARPERMHAIRVDEHTPQAFVPLDHYCLLFNVGHGFHRLT